MSLLSSQIRSFESMISRLGVTGRQVFALLLLGITYAAFEGIGVGMLLPVLQYLERGAAYFGENQGSGVVRLIETITSTLGMSTPLPVLLALTFVPIVARQVFRYAYQVYAGRVRFRAMGNLRARGFASSLTANLDYFLEEGQTRLINVLTSEVERGVLALPLFLQLYENVILLIVYLILLLILAPKLFPIIVVAVALVALIVRKRIVKTRKYGREISHANEAFHKVITERFAGIRLVKLRGQESLEREKLYRIVAAMTHSLTGISRMKEGIDACIAPIMVLSAFGTLYIAISEFGMTLASLGMYTFVLLRIDPLLRQVQTARQGVSAHMDSLDAVHVLIEKATSASDMASGHVKFCSLQREIVFEGVSFTYGKNEDATLRDISFTAPKGSWTAIVGRSGSGKSTLLDLIPRLRDATTGTIAIDGLPIQAFELGSLRQAFAMVDQYGFLFNDSIRSNIAYGINRASREEIEESARQAHAHGFIQELPDGYDTIIGDKGIRLSKGQRQRLALARVFLQRPKIVLLDEPTSALDAHSEALIQQALETQHGNWTIFSVAHRLSTTTRADQILVLEKGALVERGTHDELLTKEGLYARLWHLQYGTLSV